ncbi:DUF2635 domain-containing protein [Pseudomonas sp. F(2018)]|uniref:DUF2635 domain-containing protein n=1 Tax=Pseudomonas sp. F(2018) TaxID=2502240 RepID=UPI0010F75EFF|nr:DUF2635 domain-containing protein [Pseudomonas sp. F(2018)]
MTQPKPEYLVPAEGLKVRHPQGGYLPPEGDYVVLDSYWRRQLADESVQKGQPPKPAKPPKPEGKE